MPGYPANTDLQIGLGVLTEPASEPVTLAEAKAQVRQGSDMTLDDTLLNSLIKAARRHCETVTRRSMIHTTYRMVMDRFPMSGDYYYWASYNGGAIRLPRSPAAAIVAGGAYAYDLPRVQYYDGSGVLQTLTLGVHYETDFYSNPPCLQLMPQQFWPMAQIGRAKPVIVDFVAGYGPDGSSVPEDLKLAIKLLVGHWYENRAAVITGTISGPIDLALRSILGTYHDGGYP